MKNVKIADANWADIKKEILFQDLGSWKNIKILSITNIGSDIIRFIKRENNFEYGERNALKIILNSSVIYCYENSFLNLITSNEFQFDFDPVLIEGIDDFKEILLLFKSIAEKFEITVMLVDESFFGYPLVTISSSDIILHYGFHEETFNTTV